MFGVWRGHKSQLVPIEIFASEFQGVNHYLPYRRLISIVNAKRHANASFPRIQEEEYKIDGVQHIRRIIQTFCAQDI